MERRPTMTRRDFLTISLYSVLGAALPEKATDAAGPPSIRHPQKSQRHLDL